MIQIIATLTYLFDFTVFTNSISFIRFIKYKNNLVIEIYQKFYRR